MISHVYNKQHLPAVQLDTTLKNKKYLIISHVINGLGDIACGFRLADNLISRLGLSKDNIFIATNSPEDTSLFNKHNLSVLRYDEVKKIQDISLKIIMPASNIYNAGPLLVGRTPTLCLFEYGYELQRAPVLGQNDFTITAKSLGLNANSGEIGIMIDPILYEWGFSNDSNDPLKRIGKMVAISENLRDTIIGKGDFKIQSEAFATKSKLYFGYCSKDKLIAPFLGTVAKLNTNDSKDLSVVIPGGHYTFFLENEKLMQALRDAGIGSIEFKRFDANQGKVIEEKNVHLNDSKKKLTVITGRVDNQDMRYLWMASEKESLATGDQSLSEAISTNKSFVYETLDHKDTLQKSLEDVYRRQIACIRPDYHTRFESDSDRMLETFKRNQADNYAQISRLNQDVCMQRDCLSNLPSLMKTTMEADPSKLEKIINFKDSPEQFSASNIPFDINCYLSLAQVMSLRIGMDTGTSALPELKDSIFEFTWVGPETYGIRRKKNTSVSK